MNSSIGPYASSAGTRLSTRTSLSSRSSPISRPRMMSLRATSCPERSSRGSGSVKPRARASRTICEKLVAPSYTLKRYASVPENLPSTRLVGRRVALLVGGAPAPESHPRFREQHAPRSEHAAHAQIELALPSQPLALRGELIEQHTAHRAGPDHADGDGVRREIQSRMH